MRDASLQGDFDEFWRACPHKVGKLATEKLYYRVRAGGVTREELLDGLFRYIAHKPEYADWCHPVTFLRQGRWLDEPASKVILPRLRVGHRPTSVYDGPL